MRQSSYATLAPGAGVLLLAVLAISAGALSSLPGCSSPGTVEVERAHPHSRALLDQYVVFDNDSAVADRLSLERVVQSPDAEPLVVQFDFRNTSNDRYELWYKARWLDPDALLIADPTEGWRLTKVLPRERFGIKLVAPSRDPVDYRLVIKGDR